MTKKAPSEVLFFPPPLIAGNLKLGKAIWHFALPAGETCPGESIGVGGCAEDCYAKGGHYLLTSVRRRYEVNDALRHTRDFSHRVRYQIRNEGIRTVRIHSSGDFDSLRYIALWHKIVASSRTTTFYAYTRSWRDSAGNVRPRYVAALTTLAALPNMRMWFSCDKVTGPPPEVAGVMRAYLTDDTEPAEFPVDLVFRKTRTTYAVTIGDALVCPVERKKRKVTQISKLTCNTCRLCFDRTNWLQNRNQQTINLQG